jgi:hypothetical protein
MAAAIALGAGGLSLKNWSHKDASGGTLASRRPQVSRVAVVPHFVAAGWAMRR